MRAGDPWSVAILRPTGVEEDLDDDGASFDWGKLCGRRSGRCIPLYWSGWLILQWLSLGWVIWLICVSAIVTTKPAISPIPTECEDEGTTCDEEEEDDQSVQKG